MTIRSDEWLGRNEFVWFFGIVEDRNDPLKSGRVRVRCYGWHTDDRNEVPTNTLPWAQVLQQSAAMGDIGKTPLGYVEGTSVLGFFLDGKNAQQPMILGSFSGIPTELGSLISTKGFSDPSGTYPSRINEPDVNRLARNQTDYVHPVLAKKETSRTTAVSIANSDSTWDEPISAYAAECPYNHVYESESGHIREYDDTKDQERIHEYHTKGTFYEIDKDGNKTTRIVGNCYEIVIGSEFVNIKQASNVTVGTSSTLKTPIFQIEGDVNITGNVIVSETITAKEVIASGVVLTTHKHSGIIPGSALTKVPVPEAASVSAMARTANTAATAISKTYAETAVVVANATAAAIAAGTEVIRAFVDEVGKLTESNSPSALDMAGAGAELQTSMQAIAAHAKTLTDSTSLLAPGALKDLTDKTEAVLNNPQFTGPLNGTLAKLENSFGDLSGIEETMDKAIEPFKANFDELQSQVSTQLLATSNSLKLPAGFDLSAITPATTIFTTPFTYSAGIVDKISTTLADSLPTITGNLQTMGSNLLNGIAIPNLGAVLPSNPASLFTGAADTAAKSFSGTSFNSTSLPGLQTTVAAATKTMNTAISQLGTLSFG